MASVSMPSRAGRSARSHLRAKGTSGTNFGASKSPSLHHLMLSLFRLMPMKMPSSGPDFSDGEGLIALLCLQQSHCEQLSVPGTERCAPAQGLIGSTVLLQLRERQDVICCIRQLCCGRCGRRRLLRSSCDRMPCTLHSTKPGLSRGGVPALTAHP